MAEDYSLHLDNTKRRLAKLFGKKMAHEIFRYSASMMDTEKYVMFTKYVRSIVKEYLHAFLLNLYCDYFEAEQSSLDTESKKNPLNYIQKNSFIFQRKLYDTSLNLVGKRLVFDYMSTNIIREKLNEFFGNISKDGAIREHIKELANFKSHVAIGEMDVAGLKDTLESKKKILEIVLKTYLTIKETVYKNLGYDVELEYKDISDFKFNYKDPRFQDEKENVLALEFKVMQETIRIMEPEGDGDIVSFLEQLRPEAYGLA